MPVGKVLDRYGEPSGRFLGEPGSSISARGMPQGAERGLAKEFGAAAAKGSPDWFDGVARAATKIPDSGKLVLGHFTKKGVSYQKMAAHYKATYFKVDDWASVTKGLSRDEIWKVNETFLNQQIKQGKQILLSHNPATARAGSFFEKEVTYLGRLGYTFKQNNQWTWEAMR